MVTRIGVAQPVFTIGPKLGYTFGASGGFTFGGELSFFPNWNNPNPSFNLDITSNNSGLTTFHLGVQLLSIVYGIDVGPSILLDSGKIYGGISFIPFIGALFYYYYEFDIASGIGLIRSDGGYLKIPLFPFPEVEF